MQDSNLLIDLNVLSRLLVIVSLYTSLLQHSAQSHESFLQSSNSSSLDDNN